MMRSVSWRAFFLNTGVIRAMTEALILQVAILVVWLLYFHAETLSAFLSDSRLFFLLYGPGCVFWVALRLRLVRGSWVRQAKDECYLAVMLFCESVVGTILATVIIPIVREMTLRVFAIKPSIVVVGPFLFVALACSCLFLGVRISIRAWLYWDSLRRTRLRWALTHAQVLVVGVAVFLLSLLVVTILSRFFSTTSTAGPLFAVLLLFCLFLFIVTVLVLLPPFAVFSYWFVRPITKRIEKLATATTALRAGDYAVRVKVEGADEVAHLQADFNAMAAHLEHTLKELQHERDTVAALLQQRRELIANVSHDLRTPVATVRSYLESALANWNGEPPPTLQQDMRVMEQQTIRLQSLIDDLFLLARAEVRQLELRCEPTNVQELAQRAVEALAPLAWRGSKVEVVLEIASSAPPARVDGARLEQVMQNLLYNAIRHTPPGGIVGVLVDADEEYVRVQVKDTGEGIAADHLERIWERFYRVDSARTQQHGGAGLGLAIVKELTEAMGGRVSVTSQPGEGACFTLLLPKVATIAGPTQTGHLMKQS